MDSKTIRAIDFFENNEVDEAALEALIQDAVRVNTKNDKKKSVSSTKK